MLMFSILVMSVLHVAALPGDPPDVFRSLGHDEARSAAAEEGRLLIVDFTASWCGPCHRMDQTTWVDEGVVTWIDQHALAVQVDVDEQEDLQSAYEIQAMPTIVVLRDGEELDRVVGYRDAEARAEGVGSVRAVPGALRFPRASSSDRPFCSRPGIAATLNGVPLASSISGAWHFALPRSITSRSPTWTSPSIAPHFAKSSPTSAPGLVRTSGASPAGQAPRPRSWTTRPRSSSRWAGSSSTRRVCVSSSRASRPSGASRPGAWRAARGPRPHRRIWSPTRRSSRIPRSTHSPASCSAPSA
ncbi:MAG: thioredoxin family protein [Planctomycetes bacterium]|nr:thioredoxin family protein [Planctomycetota bacterium]